MLTTTSTQSQAVSAPQPGQTPAAGPTFLVVDWKPLDHARPPEEGIWWVVVNAPEYDCDVDGDGRTVGRATGDIEQTVAMVHLSVDPEGGLSFDPVDGWNLGKVSEESWVSHYAEVVLPKAPSVVASCQSRHTVERHGSGWAIYTGRNDSHHGLNWGQLSECDEGLAKRVELGLNLAAELSRLADEVTPDASAGQARTPAKPQCAEFAGLLAFKATEMNEGISAIVFASGLDEAKKLGADKLDTYLGALESVERAPHFDKYALQGTVPVLELMKDGWAFHCPWCGARLEAEIEGAEYIVADAEEAFCNHEHMMLEHAERSQWEAEDLATIEAAVLTFPGITGVESRRFGRPFPDQGTVRTALFDFPGRTGEKARWEVGDSKVTVSAYDREAWDAFVLAAGI